MSDQYPSSYRQGGQPQYPPQYESQYPPQYQQQQYPPAYGQGGQPQYPPYPQPPYGQAAPPSQHPYYQQGQPHVATMPQQKVSNPYATRALIYGILSLVALGIALFTDYFYVGFAGLYAIYYSIRGMSYSRRLPGNKGLAMSIIALILSCIGVLGTIGVIALIALSNSGALSQ